MKLLLILFFILSTVSLSAQNSLKGTIKDKETDEPIPGVVVMLDPGGTATLTDAKGSFLFDYQTPGRYLLKVKSLGYFDEEIQINTKIKSVIEIKLRPSNFINDDVTVSATRASDKSGMVFTELSKEEITERNLGQDIPYLLRLTPSVVSTSDAGAGVGYTGIRIRGSDPTRVNVTINGIPLNDAESQGVFWVNLPDFASSLESIQVQRGVGTSTNGAGAFGATVNLQTIGLNEKPYAEIANSYGSFNTRKHTFAAGTGLIKDKFVFDARLSKIASDGYIDRATSDLQSYFVSGAYYGPSTTVRLNVFSGKEITYQAWNGVPEDSLATNRTYNVYTYDNQVDNYRQDHYQLLFSQQFGGNWNFNTALHYTKGQGYFEQFKEGEAFSDYGLEDVIINNETITETDLVRRRWLDNDFYGGTYSLIYDNKDRFSLIIGGGWNQYDGDHFGEIIWAQYASNGSIGHRYYFNNALKTDFNTYAKATYKLSEKFYLFGDLQYRRVNYAFLGFDNNLNNIPQSVSHNFFNPKVGVTFEIDSANTAYTSFAVGHREPNRDDYVDSSPDSRPRPERLYDLEAGYKFENRRFSASFNYFLMIYNDQLILTGQVNDVGGYTRTNVADSYRTGAEIEAGWRISGQLDVAANATFSFHKIKAFTEFIDDYDQGIQILIEHPNTDIAFSPRVITTGVLRYRPFKGFTAELTAKHVGKQFLDNTSDENRKLNPFTFVDLRLNYTLKPSFMKAIDFTLSVYNLFNEKYESNGYTFGFISGGETVRENYYYPQAGIHVLGGITLRF